MKILVKIWTFFMVMLLPMVMNAQCAMCRTQVVNNVSHGETSLAAGLNFGILYLFFTPYLIIAVVAFLWFRNAKTKDGKKRFTRPYQG